jgi:hypothetical protein
MRGAKIMELPQTIIEYLDAIPLTDLEIYVQKRYTKLTESIFKALLESTDGNYILQAQTIKDLKPGGF